MSQGECHVVFGWNNYPLPNWMIFKGSESRSKCHASDAGWHQQPRHGRRPPITFTSTPPTTHPIAPFPRQRFTIDSPSHRRHLTYASPSPHCRSTAAPASHRRHRRLRSPRRPKPTLRYSLTVVPSLTNLHHTFAPPSPSPSATVSSKEHE